MKRSDWGETKQNENNNLPQAININKKMKHHNLQLSVRTSMVNAHTGKTCCFESFSIDMKDLRSNN